MSEQLATDLGHLVEELAQEARPTEPANLARLGEQVASLFKAKSYEVAVLALTGQDKFLKFIIPENLQAIGTHPMTSSFSGMMNFRNLSCPVSARTATSSD